MSAGKCTVFSLYFFSKRVSFLFRGRTKHIIRFCGHTKHLFFYCGHAKNFLCFFDSVSFHQMVLLQRSIFHGCNHSLCSLFMLGLKTPKVIPAEAKDKPVVVDLDVGVDKTVQEAREDMRDESLHVPEPFPDNPMVNVSEFVTPTVDRRTRTDIPAMQGSRPTTGFGRSLPINGTPDQVQKSMDSRLDARYDGKVDELFLNGCAGNLVMGPAPPQLLQEVNFDGQEAMPPGAVVLPLGMLCMHS